MNAVDKAKAWDAIAEKNAEIGRLRKGIQDYLDGNYPHSRSYRPNACPHGLLWFNGDCDQCAEEHFTKLLEPVTNGYRSEG
jgi:hypothetical protein